MILPRAHSEAYSTHSTTVSGQPLAVRESIYKSGSINFNRKWEITGHSNLSYSCTSGKSEKFLGKFIGGYYVINIHFAMMQDEENDRGFVALSLSLQTWLGSVERGQLRTTNTWLSGQPQPLQPLDNQLQ